MRIALVGTDVAGMMEKFQAALAGQGHQVTTVCLREERFAPGKIYDVYLPLNRSQPQWKRKMTIWAVLLRLVASHDVFIYIYSRTLLGQGREFKLLKSAGKQLAVITCGCDVRHWSRYAPWAREHGIACLCDSCQYNNSADTCDAMGKQTYSYRIDRWADIIFSSPASTGFIARKALPTYVPLDLSVLGYHWEPAEVPVLLHCPSSVDLKGTRYVTAAVSRLLDEGHRFHWQLLQEVNHSQVMEALRHSHIVIDQLLSPAYGIFALEAMATGNVVVSSARNDLCGKPDGLPIVYADPDTIYHALKNLLSCPEQWEGIALKGRQYTEKYHDHHVVGRYMMEVLEK